tara:strand:- start:207463 stop:208065 length:603 start_codon:yes stop_codon:yes gene_type:complete
MKSTALFTLICFSSFVALSQQKGYDWGYIITEKGDTVEGWVSDRAKGSFSDLYSKIRFKKDGQLFKSKYSANDLLGYGYLGAHFVSLPLVERTEFFKTQYILRAGRNRRFLRVIERNDCLNHYEVEFTHDDNFTIDSYPLYHKPGSQEMVRVTQGLLGLKKKRLTEYFNDCHDMQIAIDSKEITTAQQVYTFYCEQCKGN